jgi:hypothetical protein
MTEREVELLLRAQRAATSVIAARVLLDEVRALGLAPEPDAGFHAADLALASLVEALARIPVLVAGGAPVLAVDVRAHVRESWRAADAAAARLRDKAG